MKRVLLAFVIGFIAMGCRNFEKGEEVVERTYYGVLIDSFCEGYIFDFTESNNPNIEKRFIGNAQWIDTKKIFENGYNNVGKKYEIKFSYNAKNNNATACPGFSGYDYKIDVIRIKEVK